MCDKRQRPCRKVTVMGNGFLNSTNITCHVKEFKVSFLMMNFVSCKQTILCPGYFKISNVQREYVNISGARLKYIHVILTSLNLSLDIYSSI